MNGTMTMSPEMLAMLQQALGGMGGMQGTPGLGAMPDMAQYVMPGGPQVAGPPAPGGAAPQGPQFPWNAAALAGLGAAGMGLRAGQRPAGPMAGTPSVAARAPGGFQPTYNRLPGGRG
jgi:hypothetical protein